MMKKILLVAVAALLSASLAGCLTTPAPPATIQTVEVPVAVPCKTEKPARPALPIVPKTGLFDQVKSLLARDKLREAYEGELVAVIDACAGPPPQKKQ